MRDTSTNDITMMSLLHNRIFAWFITLLVGVAGPGLAMLWLGRGLVPLSVVGGPILAIGLMGVGMIGTAAVGRLGIGVVLALVAGAGLLAMARGLGMPSLSHPTSTALALTLASISFAARGALFARSADDRGWWIAVFVVAGEVSILLTALAMPDALPDWLLALLPAQWASVAIQTALTGSGALAAGSALLALGGTAAATLLVASLWPRRWPYLVMFTTWLCLSALVWHRPGPPMPAIGPVVAEPRAGQTAPGA